MLRSRLGPKFTSLQFTGGVSGGRTWTFDNPSTTYASVVVYGKGEAVFENRKYQLVNVSHTWTDQSVYSAEQAGADIESAIGATQ